MMKTTQEFIAKIEQRFDWALFLIHILKAKSLESQAEVEQAIIQLWMAICVINDAKDDERVCMLDHLLLACKSSRVFCNTAPLLLGIAALNADQTRNLHLRHQLLSAAFCLSPFDEELLALVERRGWQAFYFYSITVQ